MIASMALFELPAAIYGDALAVAVQNDPKAFFGPAFSSEFM